MERGPRTKTGPRARPDIEPSKRCVGAISLEASSMKFEGIRPPPASRLDDSGFARSGTGNSVMFRVRGLERICKKQRGVLSHHADWVPASLPGVG